MDTCLLQSVFPCPAQRPCHRIHPDKDKALTEDLSKIEITELYCYSSHISLHYNETVFSKLYIILVQYVEKN